MPPGSDKPYTVYTVGADRRRRAIRAVLFTLVGLVVMAAVGVGGVYAWTAATLSGANRRVDPGVAGELGPQATVTSQAGAVLSPATTVTVPAKPGTMNILVLGSDMRPDDGDTYGRSDTMMVVHVDPDADFVSVLSLPRDLQVDLGQYGVQKLNAAYAFGGDALAISTVRDLTGLQIDHFVNINFDAFRQVTTQIGGVYVDVDRRYLYVGPDYERIDIQPGYQRLAGNDALQYVRFRHDLDSDWGRIARQQRFLRTLKDQVLSWNMAAQLPGVVSLFMNNVTTEIGATDAFSLAWFATKLDFGRLKTVTLVGSDQSIGGVSFVVASRKEVSAAVDDFLALPSAGPAATTTTTAAASTTTEAGTTPSTSTTSAAALPAGTRTASDPITLKSIKVEVQNATGRTGAATAAGAFLESHGAQLLDVGDFAGAQLGASVVFYPGDHRLDCVADAALVAQALGITKMIEDESRTHVTVVLGRDFVQPAGGATLASVEAAQWRYLQETAGFGLMSPTWLPPDYSYAGSRVYQINAEKGPQPALKVMYRWGNEDQYLGLMETTFVDAPAASAGETFTAGGTVFTVVTAGDRVDRVWWKRDGVLYWISNTLAYSLTRVQMAQVAKSMVAVR
jgi:LCP family protein required for cell wall assembly